MSLARIHLALAVALAATACTGVIGESAAPPPAADPSGRIDADDDRLRHNHAHKLSTNGLILDPAIELSPAPLGDTWLSDTEVALAADSPLFDLAATAEGRELLRYLALCALEPDVSLVIPGASEPARLPGLYALAPAWADSPLEATGQRWVSACLLAHANASGEAVWVSLRGAHPGLAWDSATTAAFPVQEAAYYGNLFAGGTEPALYACLGESLFDGAWATQDSYLHGRLCGVQPGSCGLVQTGPCASLTGEIADSLTAACAVPAGESGGFADCRTERASITAPVIAEVITVYLAP